MRIIAIANQKGGVGKTTTAINLSASLSFLGKRVLLIDTDTQGNTGSGLGFDKNELEFTVYEVLTGQCGIRDAILHTELENLAQQDQGDDGNGEEEDEPFASGHGVAARGVVRERGRQPAASGSRPR